MNYGKRTPSVGTPSVYSHVTSRSTANLRSSRSVRSIRIPWYRKPLLQDAYFLDIQRASLLTACYSFVSTFLQCFLIILESYVVTDYEYFITYMLDSNPLKLFKILVKFNIYRVVFLIYYVYYKRIYQLDILL